MNWDTIPVLIAYYVVGLILSVIARVFINEDESSLGLWIAGWPIMVIFYTMVGVPKIVVSIASLFTPSYERFSGEEAASSTDWGFDEEEDINNGCPYCGAESCGCGWSVD